MRDRYFFDKRDWKRRFVKYGLIFLISFVPIVLFNVYCSDYIDNDALVVFLDCIFLLIFVVIGNIIANKIFARKDAKLERLRRERDELEERKKQIMEDSYKRKRAEKEKAKAEKNADPVIVVEDVEGVKADEVQESKNKKITKSITQVKSKKSTQTTKVSKGGGKKK